MVTEGQIRIDPQDNEVVKVIDVGNGWRTVVIDPGYSMTSVGSMYPTDDSSFPPMSTQNVEKWWPVVDEVWLAKQIIASYE